MKKHFAYIGFLILVKTSYGQVIPNSNTSPSSVSGVHAAPSAYSNNLKVTFVRTWNSSEPIAVVDSVISTYRTIQEVKQVTQYFDDQGRSIQTVAKQVTPGAKDMVTPQVYDDLGREQYKYLPYVPIDSNTNDGKFKRNPFNEQATFFASSTFNPGLSGEQVYYSKSVFEASALNRADTVFAPGNSWGGSHVGKVVNAQVNTAADSVLVWNMRLTGDSTPVTTAKYAAGTLSKNVAKDENGKQVVEYKDIDGRVVLKKVQIDNSPSSHHTGWLCTYYIYDDLNNLRYVIQPLGVDSLRIRGWQFDNTLWRSSSIAKDLCFIYQYDDLHRMIIKKVPGAGEFWMVYDARDRLVMSQDSDLRAAGKWRYTQYDGLNRSILSGLWTESHDRSYHQNSADGSTTYPSPSSNYEVLTENYYDDYAWTSGPSLSSTFISTYSSNTSYFYSPSNTTFPYPQSITPYYITNSLPTGNKIKVLGSSSTYLYTVSFYDDHGRVIQTQSTNYSGGKDTVTMQYSFEGKLLRNFLCHQKSGTNVQKYQVLTKNEYDPVGRLTKISKKVGNSPEVVLTENTYDELGQLQLKKVGRKRDNSSQNTYTGNTIDSIAYTYNIRGWIRGINKDYARGGSTNTWFGEEMTYDFGFSQTQLNGNLAGIRWRARGDGEQRAYGFTYDNVNRFSKADFTQYTSSAWNTSAGLDFSVRNMSYDANGNILTMTQKGWNLSGSFIMDSLTYGYNGNSNRLNYVTDKTNDSTSVLGDFKEFKNNTTQDYAYDGNGNLVLDSNKRITSITYNHLNLPTEITVNITNPMSGTGTIDYTYDALGNKLAKTVYTSYDRADHTVDSTAYLNDFVYETYQKFNDANKPYASNYDDILQFIMQEEGRIRPATSGNSDTMYYDYFEKDHLGNVRTVLTDQLKTDSYPAATMETASATTEETYYSNLPITRVTAPGGYPSISGNVNVAKVRQATGTSNPTIGPAILLKVMVGDTVSILANSWWSTFGLPGTPNNISSELLSDLSTSLTGVNNDHYTPTQIAASSALSSGISSFLGTQSSVTGAKAFVNWILFDEHLNYVSSSSGFDQVGSNGTYTTHSIPYIPMSKSGYLYIYVSNASPNYDVYFDNLQVTHKRGPLLEESSYYPFGVTMQGISSKALNFGDPENKKRTFQGQEFNEDLGLNMYEFKYRMDDPQIGRFWQIDPLSDKYVYNSTYAFSENQVTTHIELEGKEKKSVNGDDKPLSGSTITNKVERTTPIFNSGVGDDISFSLYKGKTSGEEGSLATTNTSTVNKKTEGHSITLLGVLNLGYGDDYSITVGVGAFGAEVHGTLGLGDIFTGKGFGLIKASAGGSYTDKEGNVTGGDLKFQVGIGAAVAVVAPELLPGVKSSPVTNPVVQGVMEAIHQKN